MPHQCASLRQQARPRRGARHKRLSPCGTDGHLRHFVECALPRLRRRARHQRHAENGAEGRIHLRAVRRGLFADARRDGRGDIHRQSRACAGSPPTIHTNCRWWNISARSTGAPASICRKRISRRRSKRSSLEDIELAPGEKAVLPSSFRRSSSSSSSRSRIQRSSST